MIDAPLKWLDNLLSHFNVPEVGAERRGVARRISYAALLRLALARELHIELGVGVRDALAIASDLLGADDAAVFKGGHLRVSFNRPAFERTVSERLRDALESAPAPRRGRPPKKPGTHSARSPSS